MDVKDIITDLNTTSIERCIETCIKEGTPYHPISRLGFLYWAKEKLINNLEK